MIGLILGFSVGLVVGSAIVYATLNWVSSHVATVEKGQEKYAIVQTDRILFTVKIRKGN